MADQDPALSYQASRISIRPRSDHFTEPLARTRSSASIPTSHKPSEQAVSDRPFLAHLPSVTSPSSPTESLYGLGSPRTPVGASARLSTSAFNSPSQAFRADDDVFVLEIGARHLRMGLGGEGASRAYLSFEPETGKRVGDWSAWIPEDFEGAAKIPLGKRPKYESWGQEHELYRLDLREMDLRLVGDKLERAVRNALVEHLLVIDDSKRRVLMLSVDPMLPHPLLSVFVQTLFDMHPIPVNIQLFSNAVMCCVAAGLRAGLVVDIGWNETVVTAIYELREARCGRTARGCKRLSWEVKSLLEAEMARVSSESEGLRREVTGVILKDTEEVMHRMCWCPSDSASPPFPASHANKEVDIPLTSQPNSGAVTIPFRRLSEPVTKAFLSESSSHPQESKYHHDDNESPVSDLIFMTLLRLPVDVRAQVVPRILFTGGGSSIPGLKTRLLQNLRSTVAARGWDPVECYGNASGKRPGLIRPSRLPLDKLSEESGLFAERVHRNTDLDPASDTPAHLQPQLPDPTSVRLQRQSEKQPSVETEDLDNGGSSKVRSVQTLGAWVGASLLAGLRVKSTIELDRETWLGRTACGGMFSI